MNKIFIRFKWLYYCVSPNIVLGTICIFNTILISCLTEKMPDLSSTFGVYGFLVVHILFLLVFMSKNLRVQQSTRFIYVNKYLKYTLITIPLFYLSLFYIYSINYNNSIIFPLAFYMLNLFAFYSFATIHGDFDESIELISKNIRFFDYTFKDPFLFITNSYFDRDNLLSLKFHCLSIPFPLTINGVVINNEIISFDSVSSLEHELNKPLKEFNKKEISLLVMYGV